MKMAGRYTTVSITPALLEQLARARGAQMAKTGKRVTTLQALAEAIALYLAQNEGQAQ